MSWWSRSIVGAAAFALITGYAGVRASSFDASRPQARSEASAGAQAAVASNQSASSGRALLDRYCVSCHSEKAKAAGRAPAGLALDSLDINNVHVGAETWEKVIRKLQANSMPPAGMPQPADGDRNAFAAFLENEIDVATLAKPHPGGAIVHRLNRSEYSNAVRDLLELEFDSRSLLPSDDASLGFDNIAEVHSISPMRLERYMSAARRVSALAIGGGIDAAVHPYSMPQLLMQDDRMGEDLPFGSAGGIAIRHYFPLDGEYIIRVRLRRNLYGYIRGLSRPRQLDVRVGGHRVAMASIGGPPGSPSPVKGWAGAVVQGIRGSPDWEDYMLHADKVLEFRFAAKAGARTVSVSFEKNPSDPEGVLQPRAKMYGASAEDDMDGGNPAVDTVFVQGPYNATGTSMTPSRRKIFVCRPATSQNDEEERCARTTLSTLSRRAYRRPVSEQDVQTLVGFYEQGRRAGGFDAGIRRALERLLVDPEFLFRIERDPAGAAPGTVYRLSDLALASRLSFFLWSSIPDDELLDTAIRGKLKDPAILEAQVRRMLRDPRSKALGANFVSQWLDLRRIEAIKPDPETFREFTENLRHAFVQEAELFIDSQLREDRSVVDLLSADYTFVNEPLAHHYGIPNVYGSHFRRISLSGDARNGLLGKASVLMATSYANRTSPVVRGKWLLENILGAPPPPPPPNVPSLESSSSDGKPRSMRERLDLHRRNPICASCHNRIDPLGFTLENFDAVGKWRSVDEGGRPVDASGALPNGTTLNGPAALREYLLQHRENFVDTFTEKLLTYALGRGLEYYDRPTIRKIVRDAAPHDFRWSAIVVGIVKSAPFQMRSVQDTKGPQPAAAAVPQSR